MANLAAAAFTATPFTTFADAKAAMDAYTALADARQAEYFDCPASERAEIREDVKNLRGWADWACSEMGRLVFKR